MAGCFPAKYFVCWANSKELIECWCCVNSSIFRRRDTKIPVVFSGIVSNHISSELGSQTSNACSNYEKILQRLCVLLYCMLIIFLYFPKRRWKIKSIKVITGRGRRQRLKWTGWTDFLYSFNFGFSILYSVMKKILMQISGHLCRITASESLGAGLRTGHLAGQVILARIRGCCFEKHCSCDSKKGSEHYPVHLCTPLHVQQWGFITCIWTELHCWMELHWVTAG